MTEDSDAKDPRALLVRALQKAGIPQRDTYPKRRLLQSSCDWEDTDDGDIEITFWTWHYRAGRLTCSIRVFDLASSVINVIPEHDALNALTDACLYLKEVVLTLLSVTHNNVLARAYNLAAKSLPRSDKASRLSLSALFEMLTSPYSDSRSASEKRLRAEPKSRRGGSDPRLPSSQRESLHAQYEVHYVRAKRVKRDYNVKLKEFQGRRRARGYTHKEWVDYWMKDAHDYPDEIQEYLALFAEIDNPSASDIAYRILAAQTGHKRSYLERLVAESRKSSKKPTMKP
jgi:hypothetical protein